MLTRRILLLLLTSSIMSACRLTWHPGEANIGQPDCLNPKERDQITCHSFKPLSIFTIVSSVYKRAGSPAFFSYSVRVENQRISEQLKDVQIFHRVYSSEYEAYFCGTGTSIISRPARESERGSVCVMVQDRIGAMSKGGTVHVSIWYEVAGRQFSDARVVTVN